MDFASALNKSIIATDMDEVLVNICPVWHRKLVERANFFGPWLDVDPKTIEEIMGRGEYYLDKWLTRPNVGGLPRDVHSEFMSLYIEDDFYADCDITEMGKAIWLASKSSGVDQIYVVSHTIPGTEQSKLDWLRRHMPSDKIELIAVPPGVPKSEFLKTVDYTMYIDDRIDILLEVMRNSDSIGKQFLYPILGYNTDLDAAGIEASLRHIELLGYRQDFQKGETAGHYDVHNR
jgi:hypothetical protein